MKTIMYKTVLSYFKKGEKPCYRAIPLANGVLSLKDVAQVIAEQTGLKATLLLFYLKLFIEQLVETMKAGNNIVVENLLYGGLAVSGVFEAANSPWDKSKHKLVPYFVAKGKLKSAFSDVVGENVTEGNHCMIRRVVDPVAKTEGVIVKGENVTVYVSGLNLNVNMDAEDEGCWLEDSEGVVVATATVTDSTSTTLDAVFASMPKAGNYKLVVASRGGLGLEFGVSIARKAVEVREADNN